MNIHVFSRQLLKNNICSICGPGNSFPPPSPFWILVNQCVLPLCSLITWSVLNNTLLSQNMHFLIRSPGDSYPHESLRSTEQGYEKWENWGPFSLAGRACWFRKNSCIKLVGASGRSLCLFVCLFICFFRAAPAASGSSQARTWVGATAANLCHSHSNVGSEPHLQPTPQLTARPDP